MEQNKIIDAGNVEKKLLEFCKKKTEKKEFCDVCPIKDYCFAFLEITASLDLALENIKKGEIFPPINDYFLNLRKLK